MKKNQILCVSAHKMTLSNMLYCLNHCLNVSFYCCSCKDFWLVIGVYKKE